MSDLHDANMAFSVCSLDFFGVDPALTRTLLVDCDYNSFDVQQIIEPILTAPDRCQISTHYIQAITTGRRTFLISNLPHGSEISVTPFSSSWSVGRSSTCAIALLHPSVSRCHAAISHQPSDGFYITDLSSSNGTWVNRRRLQAMERRKLCDGDLLRIGALDVEFFIAGRQIEPLLECVATLHDR